MLAEAGGAVHLGRLEGSFGGSVVRFGGIGIRIIGIIIGIVGRSRSGEEAPVRTVLVQQAATSARSPRVQDGLDRLRSGGKRRGVNFIGAIVDFVVLGCRIAKELAVTLLLTDLFEDGINTAALYIVTSSIVGAKSRLFVLS